MKRGGFCRSVAASARDRGVVGRELARDGSRRLVRLAEHMRRVGGKLAGILDSGHGLESACEFGDKIVGVASIKR